MCFRPWIASLCLLLTVFSLVQADPSPGAEGEAPRAEGETDVLLHVIRREVLFFSGRSGTWTSVPLGSGEQVLQQKAGRTVAVVVTNERAIAFSAPLAAVDQVVLPRDERVVAFTVEGHVASVLTGRRAYGFSSRFGRWTVQERLQLGPP